MVSNKQFHKAVYKPDSQSTDEFIVIIGDTAAAEKYVGGDHTVALVEIVDSFDIFHTGQGSQGILARPSKQELETVFETSNANAIVEIILQKGRIISSDAPPKWGGTNDSSSGANQSSRGSHSGGR